MSESARAENMDPVRMMLEQLYDWSFERSKASTEDFGDVELTDRECEVYDMAKAIGYHEAVSCIYLNLYGGKNAFSRWLSHIEPDVEKRGQIMRGAYPDE